LGRRPLGAILHSSNEPGELSQWLCHDDSTINIVVLIIIIIIIIGSKLIIIIIIIIIIKPMLLSYYKTKIINILQQVTKMSYLMYNCQCFQANLRDQRQ